MKRRNHISGVGLGYSNWILPQPQVNHRFRLSVTQCNNLKATLADVWLLLFKWSLLSAIFDACTLLTYLLLGYYYPPLSYVTQDGITFSNICHLGFRDRQVHHRQLATNLRNDGLKNLKGYVWSRIRISEYRF
jgi:hypothetical protein